MKGLRETASWSRILSWMNQGVSSSSEFLFELSLSVPKQPMLLIAIFDTSDVLWSQGPVPMRETILTF